MPCNSEHMNPTVKERQLSTAAKLLRYVYVKLEWPIVDQLKADAAGAYGGASGDRWLKALCGVLGKMSEKDIDAIVYNGRDPMARKLADWWEEHQREDWIRGEAEAKKAKSFDTCHALAKQYLKGGYNTVDTAAKLAELTGMYSDPDDGTHTFAFEDGIIVLSSMDGLTAYKGKQVE
jgi:hypothetical protein